MYRFINKTGQEKKPVECIATTWSDRSPEVFVDVCKKLNCSQYLVGLTEEDEVEFVKAFYPYFDESYHLAVISTVISKESDLPVYAIELWKFINV
jgi:hypothetical protein